MMTYSIPSVRRLVGALAVSCALTWLANPTNAETLGYWRFEEERGFIAYDTSASQNDAVLINPLTGAPWSTDVPGSPVLPFNFPNFGSHHLNGLNDVFVVADDPSLRPTTGITIEAFVRLDRDITHNAAIVSRPSSGNGNYYQLGLRGTSNFPFFGVDNVDGAGLTIDLTTALEVGRWYHLAGTWDGTEMKLYVDYQLAGSLLLGGTIDYLTSQPVLIGADIDSPGLSWFFPGNIDEVRIKDEALTPDEFLRIEAIPEPSSLLLGALAMAGGWLFVRRGRATRKGE